MYPVTQCVLMHCTCVFSIDWWLPCDGLGQQSHWDQSCGQRPVGWSLHAQENSETKIPLWEEWQGEYPLSLSLSLSLSPPPPPPSLLLFLSLHIHLSTVTLTHTHTHSVDIGRFSLLVFDLQATARCTSWLSTEKSCPSSLQPLAGWGSDHRQYVIESNQLRASYILFEQFTFLFSIKKNVLSQLQHTMLWLMYCIMLLYYEYAHTHYCIIATHAHYWMSCMCNRSSVGYTH